VNDLQRLSIAAAAATIQRRELSPVDLADACLDRIRSVEPRLNAFIEVLEDDARRDAQSAADEIADGNYRGPMHGIPVAVKDIFDVAGVKTTAASKILADNIATRDSGVVTRLRESGAVILGKLNLHEFAFGATGLDSHFGPARNPWDLTRVTGGSSSGSGASVAAGESMGALGTDTGGSIRIPASLCGIVGIKPTFGRVSRRGVVPLSWSLDHVGPLTRTVEDCAIVLQAIAGIDPNDASSSDVPVPDYRAGLRDGVHGLRIGLPDTFFFDDIDHEVEAAVQAAAKTIESLGATVETITPPYADDLPAAVATIMLPEALSYHRKWMTERPDDYTESVRYRLELGATFLAADYVHSQRIRELVVNAWRDEVFSRCDLLLAPSTIIPAPKIDESDLSSTLALIRLTNPINLLGLPAISVPCGFTASGLPIGLQLIGRWWDEATVFRAAYAYELATDWKDRQPPI
jgi:aspartyl-tRNA(Asn)/glutamyl-tRNA(Gln) amidotransferase subunit A